MLPLMPARWDRFSSPILLAIIYLAFISLGLPDSVLGVAWPALRETLKLPLEAVGALTVLVTLASAVSSFLSGSLISRFSTGPIVLISCLLTGSALLTWASVPVFAILLLAALPLGLGAGCVDSSLNAFVARHYSARHMNWLHAFWGVGATLGPVLMTSALTSAGGWQSGYRKIAGIQLGLAVAFAATLPLWKRHEASVHTHGEGVEKPYGKATAHSPAAWISVAIYTLYTGAEGATGLWANSVLVDARGLRPETAGLWVAAYFGSIMSGRILVGLVSERWSNRQLATGGLIICLLGAFLFWVPGVSWLPLAGLILLGLGCAPVYPCLMHETPRRFSKEATPVVIGRQVGAAYVGAALIPAMIGWLAAHSSLQILGPVIGAFAGILLILLHRLNRLT